jgi:hypothetical protein
MDLEPSEEPDQDEDTPLDAAMLTKAMAGVAEIMQLGPCCACGTTGPTVRNILMLDEVAPEPGTGWGCFQCGLPDDGCLAVLCDACLEADAPITQMVMGYPGEGRRQPRDPQAAPFRHVMARHPECWRWAAAPTAGPGDPASRCASCDALLTEDHVPLLVWDGEGRVGRLCTTCVAQSGRRKLTRRNWRAGGGDAPQTGRVREETSSLTLSSSELPRVHQLRCACFEPLGRLLDMPHVIVGDLQITHMFWVRDAIPNSDGLLKSFPVLSIDVEFIA